MATQKQQVKLKPIVAAKNALFFHRMEKSVRSPDAHPDNTFFIRSHSSRLLSGRTVQFGQAADFRTGLCFRVPVGHILLITSVSQQTEMEGIVLADGALTVTPGMTDELVIRLRNDTPAERAVNTGDIIAEGVLLRLPDMALVETDIDGSPIE